MVGLTRRRRDEEQPLTRRDREPSPLLTLAVGLIYVFRTSPGGRILRELEAAVRRYAADPQALWKLVRDGERGDVIDAPTTEAPPPKELAEKK